MTVRASGGAQADDTGPFPSAQGNIVEGNIVEGNIVEGNIAESDIVDEQFAADDEFRNGPFASGKFPVAERAESTAGLERGTDLMDDTGLADEASAALLRPTVRLVEDDLVDDVLSPSGLSAPEHCPRAWASCCTDYERFATGLTRLFARDAARLVRIGPDSEVLDVAAGTGEFAFAAAQQGAHVLATDFSPGMLQLLEQRRSAQGLHNVRTALMDGQSLSLENAGFDIAGSLFGLAFFPDQHRGLRELFRVLRPGGQVVIATWATPGKVELMRLVGEAIMEACPELCAPEEVASNHWTTLSCQKRLSSSLEDAGFECVYTIELTHVWTFDVVQDFVRALPRTTPAWARLENRMTTEQKMRFHRALTESFRARQGRGPFAVTAQGLVAVGNKPGRHSQFL